MSGDPRLVAWGAHDALEAGDQTLVPYLLALADAWQPLSRQPVGHDSPNGLSPDGLNQEQLDARDAMAAVLDALIQMEVSVPTGALGNLAPDFGNDVAILLSRLPADEAAPLAMELYRSPPEHGFALQFVSASLLALHPVSGFAADLMANITVEARVVAVLPGTAAGFGGSNGSCAVLREQERKGWPSTGQYALSRQGGEGAMPLVGGIDPIYARRSLSSHFRGDESTTHMFMNLTSGQRQRLIAEMLGVAPAAIPWSTGPTEDIEFRSQQQFEQLLRAFISGEQQKQRATLADLVAHQLVTADEAEQSLPTLEIHLIDMRGESDAPLETMTDLPPRVRWFANP